MPSPGCPGSRELKETIGLERGGPSWKRVGRSGRGEAEGESGRRLPQSKTLARWWVPGSNWESPAWLAAPLRIEN